MSGLILLLIGIVLLAIAIAFILFDKSVTTGHSLLIAVGAALILAPNLTSFEWSNNSFKFTTTAESAAIANSVTSTTEDIVAVREQLTQLVDGLDELAQRIASIEAEAGTTPTSPQGTIRPLDWLDIEQFREMNHLAIVDAEGRLQDLENLEARLLE